MHTHAPTQNGANAPRSSTASLSTVIALLSCTGTRACAIGPCLAGPGAPSHARTPCLLVPSSADLGSSVGHRIASKRRRGGSCNLRTQFLLVTAIFHLQHGVTTFFAAMHFVLHSTSLGIPSQRLSCSEEMADDQTSGDRPGLLQPQGAEGRSDEDAEAQPHSRLLPPPPANSEVAPRHDSNTPESALAPSQAFASAHSHPHSGTALHPTPRSRYTRTWHINRGPMHPHPSLRSSLTGLFSDAAGTAMAVGLTDTPTQRQLARSRKRFFV